MESLYKVCSSLIEHKRFCLSGTPDRAFVKYIYTATLAFRKSCLASKKHNSSFSDTMLSVFLFAWDCFPSGSAALSWFHVSCLLLVFLANISLTSMFSLHLYVSVFFIQVMFTVIELPLKSVKTERSATISMTLHIPGILWCLKCNGNYFVSLFWGSNLYKTWQNTKGGYVCSYN